MFENHKIESNIIEVSQVVPEICHFLYFKWVTADILDFGPYMCLKMCNPRLLFISYPSKVKSITISLWASDSYGKYTPVYINNGGALFGVSAMVTNKWRQFIYSIVLVRERKCNHNMFSWIVYLCYVNFASLFVLSSIKRLLKESLAKQTPRRIFGRQTKGLRTPVLDRSWWFTTNLVHYALRLMSMNTDKSCLH